MDKYEIKVDITGEIIKCIKDEENNEKLYEGKDEIYDSKKV